MNKDFVSENKLSDKNSTKNIASKNSDPLKKSCRGRCAFFTALLVFFSIGLLFGAKFLWDSIQIIKVEHSVIKGEHEKFQKQITLLEENSQYQEKTLSDLRNQVVASKLKGMYMEAFYLTKNAAYQMRLHNLDGSVSLLKDALETLSSVPNSKPAVSSIKEQISQMIVLIEKSQKIDDSAILEQINQLKQQIDSLPLNLPTTAFSDDEKNPSSDHASQISKGFKEGWQQLKQLIIIRHYDRNVEPLIAPNQSMYLKQNLHLQLEQATLAVFYRDPKLYRLSLEKSRVWVKKFFDPRAKSTQVFLSHLNTLLAMPVAQEMPKIGSALNQVLNQLQVFMKSSIENPPAAPRVCSIKPHSASTTAEKS
jgi:uroporphyrin-III C-methyltransferase